jgi:predicted nuclease of predicted toxin-antitoxin system
VTEDDVSRPPSLRILLDENVHPGMALVLNGLGHKTDHVQHLGLSGSSDELLCQVASDYDVFVTLDLHRQTREWLVVYGALVDSIKVLRIRLPRNTTQPREDTAKSLVSHIERWVHDFEQGARLVTIAALGSRQSVSTRQDILDMIEQRSEGTS